MLKKQEGKISLLFTIIIIFIVIAALGVYLYKINSNNQNNNNIDNSVDNNPITKEATVLYEYISSDSNAINGNPEVLKIYEINDNEMSFEYYAIWNINEIKGMAKKTVDNTYAYESLNKRIEFILNAEGDNSIKVIEYENGEMTSTISLWK